MVGGLWRIRLLGRVALGLPGAWWCAHRRIPGRSVEARPLAHNPADPHPSASRLRDVCRECFKLLRAISRTGYDEVKDKAQALRQAGAGGASARQDEPRLMLPLLWPGAVDEPDAKAAWLGKIASKEAEEAVLSFLRQFEGPCRRDIPPTTGLIFYGPPGESGGAQTHHLR
jgi:hypothetical protein